VYDKYLIVKGKVQWKAVPEIKDQLHDPRISLSDFLVAFPEGKIKAPADVFQLNQFTNALA
jgi:hypothetical protein